MPELIMLAALFIAGCGPIDGRQIDIAIKLCKTHGGINYIFTGVLRVVCKDGLDINYKLPQKEFNSEN